MSIQVYGSFGSFWSFDNVTRAITKAVARAHLPMTVYSLDAIAPKYEDCPHQVALNSRAGVGVCVSYPPASVGWLAAHKKRVLVTVCETTRIPVEWVEAANEATLVVVPSQFCAGAFKESGVRKPIWVARHGLDPTFFVDDPCKVDESGGAWGECKPGEPIRLLHVSGAVSFPQRKGTPQLLAAFQRVQTALPGRFRLCLKMPRTPGLLAVLEQLGLTDVAEVLPEAPIPPWKMRDFLRGFHAVVQPSRAEGFGMVPLEARAAGVPVLMTDTSGHREHFAAGVDIEIPMERGTTLLRTQANDVGYAQDLSIDAVYHTIKWLAEPGVLEAHQRLTRMWASARARQWGWDYTLRGLVEYLRAHGHTSDKKLGARSGMRGF